MVLALLSQESKENYPENAEKNDDEYEQNIRGVALVGACERPGVI